MSRELVREAVQTTLNGIDFHDLVDPLPIKYGNYKTTKKDKQFLFVSIVFDSPSPMFGGGKVEKGKVVVAVMVPSDRGTGLELRICERLDDMLSGSHQAEDATRGILGITQVLFAATNSIGAVGDNERFYRVDWSAPYIHNEVGIP